MGAVEAKFRKAAKDLSGILPRIDDPFWNFYRNVVQNPHPDIAIPVVFYKDDIPVAQAVFHCLGSPRQLNFLAIDQTVQSLKRRQPGLGWDSVSANYGARLTAREYEDVRSADPLIQAAANCASDLSEVIERLGKDLHGLEPSSADPEMLREGYDLAKTVFASGVTLHSASIEWPAETMRQKMIRILGLS